MGAVCRVRVKESRERVRSGVFSLFLSFSGARMEMVEGEEAEGMMEMGNVAGDWFGERVGCLR